jgi:hypothetical protein
MVFVLDKQKKPLMPTTPRRARLLLERRRAVVHREHPFTIRLKDRRVQESLLQPVALKIDPGSKTTGLALARAELTAEGEIHSALHLAELSHRGEEVREHLRALGLPITTWSGGRTRWNRDRFHIEKTHALDALCVGELAGVEVGPHRTLAIKAAGRGRYGRTNVDDSGFPVGYLMRKKQVQGIPARFCRVLQLADGYGYAVVATTLHP